MIKHSFDPVRNDDGSLSIFRITCLGILALCMLSYGSLSLFGCSDTQDAVQTQSKENSAVVEENVKDNSDTVADGANDLQKQVVKSMQEAVAYYRECGAINKGFEGCNFTFPANVLKYYVATAQAADDGFTVSLKTQQEGVNCALYETDISGVMRAFDSLGQSNDNCLK